MSSTTFFGIFFIAVILFISMHIDKIWEEKFENDVKESERRQKQIDFKIGPE